LKNLQTQYVHATLEYFTEILDIPLTNTFDAGGISTAQRYVKDWIAQAANEQVIPLAHFKVVLRCND
jgi:hypothetical protein